MESAAGYRTPLSRARGLGAAHTGVQSFISERVTSIALVPLCLWAVWAGLRIGPTGYDGAVAFLHQPVNAIAALLLAGVAFWHQRIGLRVVIEDYAESHMSRLFWLLVNGAVCWVGWAVASFSILVVALQGGAH